MEKILGVTVCYYIKFFFSKRNIKKIHRCCVTNKRKPIGEMTDNIPIKFPMAKTLIQFPKPSLWLLSTHYLTLKAPNFESKPSSSPKSKATQNSKQLNKSTSNYKSSKFNQLFWLDIDAALEPNGIYINHLALSRSVLVHLVVSFNNEDNFINKFCSFFNLLKFLMWLWQIEDSKVQSLHRAMLLGTHVSISRFVLFSSSSQFTSITCLFRNAANAEIVGKGILMVLIGLC